MGEVGRFGCGTDVVGGAGIFSWDVFRTLSIASACIGGAGLGTVDATATSEPPEKERTGLVLAMVTTSTPAPPEKESAGLILAARPTSTPGPPEKESAGLVMLLD